MRGGVGDYYLFVFCTAIRRTENRSDAAESMERPTSVMALEWRLAAKWAAACLAAASSPLSAMCSARSAAFSCSRARWRAPDLLSTWRVVMTRKGQVCPPIGALAPQR